MGFPRWIRTRGQMFWYVTARVVELLAFILILTLVFASLASCGAYPPQQYAGISYLAIEFDENGEFSRVLSINGKEIAGGAWSLSNPNGGALVISADAISAFDGHAARAEVEKALVEQGISPTPDLIDAVLKVIAQ